MARGDSAFLFACIRGEFSSAIPSWVVKLLILRVKIDVNGMAADGADRVQRVTVPLITPELDNPRPEGKPLPDHVKGPLDAPTSAVNVVAGKSCPALPLRIEPEVITEALRMSFRRSNLPIRRMARFIAASRSGTRLHLMA